MKYSKILNHRDRDPDPGDENNHQVKRKKAKLVRQVRGMERMEQTVKNKKTKNTPLRKN